MVERGFDMNVQRFKTWIPQSIGGSMLDMAVPASEFDRILAERDALQQRLNELGEQHQGEPVAWVRFRNGEPDYDGDACMIMNVPGDTLGDGDSWEPVYTRADPGEVERLRAEVKDLLHTSVKEEVFEIVCKERDTLRAQLAERDALLRRASDVLEVLKGGAIVRKAIAALLSASAEPSVPVERDERGLVELALSEYGSATGKHVLPGGINENQDGFVHGFLVRAALERKT